MTTLETKIPSGYEVRCARDVPRLGATLYDLISERTGARHVHLAVPDANNSFCVLYRTPPPDSTGVPHIMEHCVSGGSRRFPPGAGGDMYNRSLLTDINGMTQADNTTYYFATRNRTDFLNWMEYVIDVSLFPRLEEDTFLKHRGHFEFATPDDPTSGLRFVGTVFNEMKAVFGSPLHHEFQAIRRSLFDPSHPYANYAAGDPADMPSLTYEQLRTFNGAHYHPGNACFISRGDVPLEEILAATEEIVGDAFERRGPSEIGDIPRRGDAVRYEAPVPGEHGQTVLAWLTAPSTDHYARLLLEIAHEATSSKLRPVTTRVVPLLRTMFVCTLADDDPAMEERVLSVLDEAIDDETFRSAVNAIELRRREPSDALGTYLEAVLPGILYDADPYDALELEGLLARATPADVREIVQTELVENQHRTLISLRPDASLEDRVRETEERWLADVERNLTDDARERIVVDTKRLVTPVTFEFERRGLTPAEGLTELTAPEAAAKHGAVTHYDVHTGGLTYVRLRVDLSGLPDDLVPHLRRFADGIAQNVGVEARTHTRVDETGSRTVHWLEIGGRALDRDAAELAAKIERVLAFTPRENLTAAAIADIERSVMPDAQTHLRRLAASSLRRSAHYDDQVRGLSQLRHLRGRAEHADLAGKIFTTGRVEACVITPKQDIAERVAAAIASLPDEPTPERPNDVLDGPRPHRARVTQLPVAFTCEAFTIPGLTHPDAAAIAVLVQRMWAGYLNTEVRRGGAYGVDYGSLPGRGILWISSRRDPLPDNTYAAIREVVAQVVDGRFDSPSADDAKLAILRTTDPADSPAAAARRAWNASFTGQTVSLWNEYRRRVLDVTDDDTVRVAATYLGDGSRATLAGRAVLDETGPYDEIEEL